MFVLLSIWSIPITPAVLIFGRDVLWLGGVLEYSLITFGLCKGFDDFLILSSLVALLSLLKGWSQLLDIALMLVLVSVMGYYYPVVLVMILFFVMVTVGAMYAREYYELSQDERFFLIFYNMYKMWVFYLYVIAIVFSVRDIGNTQEFLLLMVAMCFAYGVLPTAWAFTYVSN